MSLLYLVHHNVVLKFSSAAPTPFTTEASYVFRLTGVDGMGFLQVQELSVTGDAAPEPVGDAYWINKDIVREIHGFDSTKDKTSLTYTGKAPVAPTPEPVNSTPREVTPKLPKAKKSVLKQKPVFN
jgi:hypothetical protein